MGIKALIIFGFVALICLTVTMIVLFKKGEKALEEAIKPAKEVLVNWDSLYSSFIALYCIVKELDTKRKYYEGIVGLKLMVEELDSEVRRWHLNNGD